VVYKTYPTKAKTKTDTAKLAIVSVPVLVRCVMLMRRKIKNTARKTKYMMRKMYMGMLIDLLLK
jgi:hypothetical protein